MKTINTNQHRSLKWLSNIGGLITLLMTQAHHTESDFEDKSECQIIYVTLNYGGHAAKMVFTLIPNVL